MRVGLVRNVGLSAVALLALGLAGCDDNPLEFEDGVGVMITTNPSTMIIPAGLTTLLETRVVDEGSRPTFEDVTWAIDAACGAATITIAEATTFEPEVQPPIVLDITGGLTLGTTCITLTGGGVTASVGVTVVGDSLEVVNAPAGSILVYETALLSSVLLADDGTPVSPFDPLTDIVWSTDNNEVAQADATGLVATGPKGGGALITATWTNAGVIVTGSTLLDIDIPVPTLTSIDVASSFPGELLITITGTGGFIGTGASANPALATVDAHRIFIDGFELQDTLITVLIGADDVDIQTSDPTIVDAPTATFLMPFGPAGDVLVTVGSLCCGESNALTVTRNDLPTPVLISTDVASADAGDVITITGTDLFTGNAVVLTGEPGSHQIFVDGATLDELLDPTIVNTTTATFRMPPGNVGLDIDIQIGDPIVGLSNTLTVTRTDDDFEPDNDGQAAGGPTITLPASITSWIDAAAGDVDDYWAFTLAADATLDITLSWTGASGDLDLLFLDRNPVTAFQCGFVTATGAVPEAGTCALVAGDYAAWVNDFDGEPGLTEYTFTLTIQP